MLLSTSGYRLNWHWHLDESLENYAVRKEQTVKKRLQSGRIGNDGGRLCPHEAIMFEEGWMCIEWTALRGDLPWVRKRKDITPSAITMLETLSTTGRYIFDDHPNLPRTPDLATTIKPAFKQMNTAMTNFLEKFGGQCLLLDNSAPDYFPKDGLQDFKPNGSLEVDQDYRITWFLRRPR